jgi:hypothetical protein
LWGAVLEFAEKLKTPSFRGTLRAEESLFSWIQTKEGFLTPFGMTIKGTYSAICLAIPKKPQICCGFSR